MLYTVWIETHEKRICTYEVAADNEIDAETKVDELIESGSIAPIRSTVKTMDSFITVSESKKRK